MIATLALTLCACGSASGDDPAAGATTVPVVASDLAGTWLVTRIDDAPPPEGETIVLTITDTILLESNCKTARWKYAFSGARVDTQYDPPIDCLRESSLGEAIAIHLLDAGFTVSRGGGKTLSFAGNGHTMTIGPYDDDGLRPQPLTFEVPPAGDPVSKSLEGEWRVAGIDGKGSDARRGMALSITDSRIDFENCQQIGWTYIYAQGRMRTTRKARDPQAGPKTRPPCAANLPPPLSDMVRTIDAAKQAVRTSENGVELSGGGHSLLLFSQ